MSNPQEKVRSMTVNDVMHREVLAVDADWSLEELAEFLVDNNISGAPVTEENGELVGVVSMTDILRHGSMPDNGGETDDTHDVYLYELERQLGHEELRMFHARDESSAQVRDIMTPMIFKVEENTSVQEVAETMLRGRIHRVFVTRGSTLTGIVTALDMLQVIRDL
jgi:CBS domain-containing protein